LNERIYYGNVIVANSSKGGCLMAEWVLIVVLDVMGKGQTVEMQSFGTLEHCETAGEKVKELADASMVSYACVNRGIEITQELRSPL